MVNNFDISRFYADTNITSSKLLQQCKIGQTSKIILKIEVFLFINVKMEDGRERKFRRKKGK